MTYDQLRADEEKAWQAYQDATEAEDRRRVEAGRELTRLCAAWAGLQRRRSGMTPLPTAAIDQIKIGGYASINETMLAECPSDHHWIGSPPTPKTCPTCGKEL